MNFNSRRHVSFGKAWTARCVRFSLPAQHVIRVHSHGKYAHPICLPATNPTHGNAEALVSGAKRFLHICNGSSNLCASKRVLLWHLRVVCFSNSPRATSTRSRRSRSAIYFPHVTAQIGCIERSSRENADSTRVQLQYVTN